MPFILRAFSLLAAIALAACATVPVLSLVSLARIDVRTTDLARLRVAIRLPEAIRPRQAGVRLDAILKIAGEADRTTSFILEETHSAVELSGLVAGERGAETHVYLLPSGEITRFDAIRATLVAAIAARKRGSLGLGVSTKEFCRAGTLPEGPIPVTTFLKTSETDSYVTVTADVDLRSQPDIAPQLATLEPCQY